MKADLHNHTTYSDGMKDIFNVLKQAKEKGLDYIAITDHDSIKGLEDGIKFAKEIGINIILGVELSTYLNEESVHLLGYFNTLEDAFIINEHFIEMKKRRNNRAIEMVKRLKKYYNIELDIDDLLKTDTNITRGNLAKLIIDKYHYSDKEIFDTILSNQSKAFIPSSKMTPKEGIELLKKANALVSLAHPTLLEKNNYVDIIQLGIDAIEARYPANKVLEEEEFIQSCKKYQMIYTAGSDYHGMIDFLHKDIATCYLKNEEVLLFLNELKKKGSGKK